MTKTASFCFCYFVGQFLWPLLAGLGPVVGINKPPPDRTSTTLASRISETSLISSPTEPLLAYSGVRSWENAGKIPRKVPEKDSLAITLGFFVPEVLLRSCWVWGVPEVLLR